MDNGLSLDVSRLSPGIGDGSNSADSDIVVLVYAVLFMEWETSATPFHGVCFACLLISEKKTNSVHRFERASLVASSLFSQARRPLVLCGGMSRRGRHLRGPSSCIISHYWFDVNVIVLYYTFCQPLQLDVYDFQGYLQQDHIVNFGPREGFSDDSPVELGAPAAADYTRFYYLSIRSGKIWTFRHEIKSA